MFGNLKRVSPMTGKRERWARNRYSHCSTHSYSTSPVTLRLLVLITRFPDEARLTNAAYQFAPCHCVPGLPQVNARAVAVEVNEAKDRCVEGSKGSLPSNTSCEDIGFSCILTRSDVKYLKSTHLR